ncbi:hypothetical protein V500_02212 [Pseudogymnoascus sp. VKM F-4518 (FW-2643)]|nr:hypothetical protein V500_02212 [Pseudogymnoascus sp. VKM F-4518 (FW-2643)]
MDQKNSTDNKVSTTTEDSKPLKHQMSDSPAAPPPSYPQVQAQVPDHCEAPPSYDKTAYPPLPHHTQAPSLTLYVWYESWRKNNVHILDSDHATTLYTLKLQVRKPQMTFDSTAAESTIATVDFSLLSRSIEAAVNGSSISLTSRGLFKNGHTWSSPVLGNVELTWKIKGLNQVCEDEQGICVAKLTFRIMSLRRAARLDMYGPEVTRSDVLEEIVVTGLAFAEYNQGLANINVLA